MTDFTSTTAPATADAIAHAVEAEQAGAKIFNQVINDPVAAEASVEKNLPALIAAGKLVVKETKAGYKTTEFWLVVVTGVLTEVGTLPIPEHAKAYVAAGLAGIYAVSRGLAKHGQPALEQPADKSTT